MAAKTARASSAASFTYAPTRAEIHEAGKTYGQQQQPPYQGPPPVPQGWNVNPSQWNSGYWQYNPNFQPAGAPPVQQMPNPTSWMPDPRWVPQYPPQQQQQQQQSQQQEQQNPFKRPIKPPSAEYMATKISENGLGLFGMEPVQGTPWIWNPRGLVEDAVEEGEITADYLDHTGRVIAKESRGMEPRRKPSKSPQPPAPPQPAPAPAQSHASRHPPSQQQQQQSQHQPQPPPQPVYRNSASGAASAGGLQRFATEPTPSRNGRSSAVSPPPPEGFTSQGALRPTFSPNIVRTPDSYSSTPKSDKRASSRASSPHRKYSDPMPSLTSRLTEARQERREDRREERREPSRERERESSDKARRERSSSRRDSSGAAPSRSQSQEPNYSHHGASPSYRRDGTHTAPATRSQSVELSPLPVDIAKLPSRILGRNHSVPVVGASHGTSSLATIPEKSTRHVSSASGAVAAASSSSRSKNIVSYPSPGELSTAKYNSASASIKPYQSSSSTPQPQSQPQPPVQPPSRSHSRSRSHSANTSPTGAGSNHIYSSNSLRRSNTQSSSHVYTPTPDVSPRTYSIPNNRPGQGMPYVPMPSPPSPYKSLRASPMPPQQSQQSHSHTRPPAVSSSSHYTSASQAVKSQAELLLPRPTPPPAHYRRRVRKGFWNKRGDYLTFSGKVVYAPRGGTYPSELSSYPDVREGYMNEAGEHMGYDPNREELAESLPRYGNPPECPYERFVTYNYH